MTRPRFEPVEPLFKPKAVQSVIYSNNWTFNKVQFLVVLLKSSTMWYTYYYDLVVLQFYIVNSAACVTTLYLHDLYDSQ